MHMSRTMHLPFSSWAIRVRPGETAKGYFCRLVAEEGHHSTAVYGNEIGINGRRLDHEEALETLLTLPIPEADKAALRRYSPHADGAYFELAGQRLRQRQLGLKARRFCPACIAEAPYHRAWWDILAFRTCPDHDVAIESTDAEGQEIGWWWADMGSDTTGSPLAKWDRSKVERSGRTFEVFVLERLGMIGPSVWPLLVRSHLYEVIEACEYLGSWLAAGPTAVVPHDQLANIHVGMAALSETRDHLVKTMREWFTERVPEPVRRQGKMRSMGWAWKAWPKLPDTTIGEMLRMAATEAFEPVGRMGRKRFDGTADFLARKALASVARELDVRVEAVLPLARHLGLVPAGLDPWELCPEGKAALESAVGDLVPSSVVSDLVGFETWEWSFIEAGGHLRSFPRFALGNLYLRTEVENLVNRIAGQNSTAEGETLSIRAYARRHGSEVADILKQVVEGNLSTVRSDNGEPGLRAIRIVAKSRRRVVARLETAAETPDVMTLSEAASTLRLYPEVVSLLVRGGRLAATDTGMVRRQDVLDFDGRYANAQLYRSALGCGDKVVRNRLSELGIGYEVVGDGVANVIVERANMRRALGLERDPDDLEALPRWLWEEFRAKASVRCPVFSVPPVVPDVGVKLRTATRKVALDATVDKTSGAVSLSFEMHPELTTRRWELFQRCEDAVRKDLECMIWSRTSDTAGWSLSMSATNSMEVERAVDVLVALHRWFR